MAAETLVIQVQSLDVVAKVLEKRYAPRDFRNVLPVGPSLPVWAENYQVVRIEQTAEATPQEFITSQETLPLAEIRTQSSTVPIVHGVMGYKAFNNEILRINEMANMVGGVQAAINPIAQRAAACMKAWEMLLDNIAAGYVWHGITFPGLYGLAAAASPTTAQVQLLTAGVKAGGSLTPWATAGATAAEIHADLVALADAIPNRSAEAHQTSKIVLPRQSYRVAASTNSDYQETNALALFRASHPGVMVQPWYQGKLKDAAGTGPRAVAFSTEDGGPEWIEPRGFSPQSPIVVVGGNIVPIEFTVVGTQTEDPMSVAYMDGI